MRNRPVRRAARGAALAAAMLTMTAAVAGPVRAQVPPPPAPAGAAPDAPPQRDCTRWPASAYDEASGLCACPSGMWWNLRGDACLPREHAAGEFCGTVWPGSQPLFGTGGSYRCVCVPPLLWDDQATACRAPLVSGEEDCVREWPGTLPVLSPSGTEFECRCPGGRRWDDNIRNCVAGAPVVGFQRGFLPPGGGGPGGDIAVPAPGSPPATAPHGVFPPSATEPRGTDEVPYEHRPAPDYRPPAPGTYPGGAPDDGGAGVEPPPVPASPPSSNPKCDALLAEIRARARAGQADQSDALGMKAAIAGCDPKAISEAARVPR